jgi:hypothetical protein
MTIEITTFKRTSDESRKKGFPKETYLKRKRADRGVLIARVSAVLDVVAKVVDVDALLVPAMPFELITTFGRLAAPKETEKKLVLLTCVIFL